MLSFKIVLDKRRQKNNTTYPLKLRVYNGTAYKEMGTKISIHEHEWDEVTQQVLREHPLYKTYNAKLTGLKAKIQKLLLLAEDSPNLNTPEVIIGQLVEKPLPKAIVSEFISFIEYGNAQVHKLVEVGKVGNSIVYSCAINKLEKYVGNNKLSFQSITYKFLNDFNDYMLSDGMRVNAISVYMRAIRAIYNKAIKEGVVSTSSYPFTGFRINHERTINRALTLQEMKQIANEDLERNSAIWHWRNYFLLSFCLIGINFADLLTLSGKNITAERLIFRRKKTAKIYSIKIHATVKNILAEYKPENKDVLLLPVLTRLNNPVQLKKDIIQAIKTCNEYLERLAERCEIDKKITTYYARYSWANIAKTLGYSKDLIAEALGHEYGNKVTGIYLDNYSNDMIDEANSNVIAAVFNPA